MQEKRGEAIFIPERERTDDEWATLGKLRSLLRDPRHVGIWRHIEEGRPAKDVQTELGHFLRGEQGALYHVECA